ncbi:hypothetical protein Droror1_Dr00005853 [Drosera rotundifolia]
MKIPLRFIVVLSSFFLLFCCGLQIPFYFFISSENLKKSFYMSMFLIFSVFSVFLEGLMMTMLFQPPPLLIFLSSLYTTLPKKNLLPNDSTNDLNHHSIYGFIPTPSLP